MKFSMAIMFFVCFTKFLSSQVTVVVNKKHIIMYSSYDDYKSKNGVDYEFAGLTGWKKIIVFIDGKKKSFPVENFWGWTFNDVLFRVDKSTKTYGALVKLGNCAYYEQGYGWMCALKNWSNYFYYSSVGQNQYVSANLESEMYAMTPDEIEEFKSTSPQQASLADCLLSNWKYWSAGGNFQGSINCVDKFLDTTNTMKDPTVIGSWVTTNMR